MDLSNLFYAGIGSRRTPPDVLEQMQVFASLAAQRKWILRSGAASGADSAFEVGCDSVGGGKEIFLPWRNFNNHPSNLYQPTSAARRMAQLIHPAWCRLSLPTQMLVSRNMHQIFGELMFEPVKFVLCWTPDGCEHYTTYGRETGGTGTAISVASRDGIPVFNLRNPDRLDHAKQILFSFEHKE